MNCFRIMTTFTFEDFINGQMEERRIQRVKKPELLKKQDENFKLIFNIGQSAAGGVSDVNSSPKVTENSTGSSNVIAGESLEINFSLKT